MQRVARRSIGIAVLSLAVMLPIMAVPAMGAFNTIRGNAAPNTLKGDGGERD